MKIKELIKELQELDGDLNVFVSGYEGGVNHAGSIGKPVIVALNVNDEWYYGSHEVVDEDSSLSGFDKVSGIII